MVARNKILQALRSGNGLSVKEMVDLIGVSKQRIHRILKELILQNLVMKQGKPPKVIYFLAKKVAYSVPQVTKDEESYLNEHFTVFTPDGHALVGPRAFAYWCDRRNLPFVKTLNEYKKTRKKYEKYKDADGLIDGMDKLLNTAQLEICLDHQYYADFYAIERFGKTRLGQLIHFGKMGQDRRLIKDIISSTKPSLERIIVRLSIDAVGYIPATLKRDVQLMTVLETEYNLPIPVIKIEKIRGEVLVPQKALSKIEDRIENARTSIRVLDKRKFNRVLLIDDALGSGATINETACELKNRGTAQMVTGFAVTGSFKGFDVLSEA